MGKEPSAKNVKVRGKYRDKPKERDGARGITRWEITRNRGMSDTMDLNTYVSITGPSEERMLKRPRERGRALVARWKATAIF